MEGRMKILDLPLKRPIAVLIILGFLAIVGFGTYFSMKYELVPEFSIPVVTITTVYPGASPREVQTGITKNLEDAVSGISKIKHVNSQSLEALSLITLSFDADTDINASLQDVQRQVNAAQTKLPTDARTPVINRFSFDDQPIIQVAATANMPTGQFYQFVTDTVKPRLSQQNGVGQVTLIGGNAREIRINLAQDRLEHYGIPILQVLSKLEAANLDFPAGNIKDSDGQYVVRIVGKLKSIAEVSELILTSAPNFGVVRLKDVADVQDTLADSTTISRLNGKTAIGIQVLKQNGTNAVEVSKRVKKELSKIEKEYADQKLKFEIADDTSVFTVDSARDVVYDILLAILLVGIVILFFLHDLRNAFIIMMAIPTTLLTTLFLMGQIDFTLNLMSLTAMTLVIGILVDDSIVVIENIHRHRALGKSAFQSARIGTREIGFAAFAITLVIVVAFLPVSFAGGTVGGVLKQFGLTIVLATAVSLLVSMTLAPLLASRLVENPSLREKPSLFGRFGTFFDRGFDRFSLFFQTVVGWTLRHKKTTLLSALAFLIGAFALAGSGAIGSEFAPRIDRGQFNIRIEFPDRTTLEENNRVVAGIERNLFKRPEVERVFTKVGYDQTGSVDNKSQINVNLVDKSSRAKSSIEIGKEVQEEISRIPGIKVQVDQAGIVEGPSNADVAYIVSGTNEDDVTATAEKWLKIVKGVQGTGEVRLSGGNSKPELQVDIDRLRMADLGLSLDTVGTSLRTALSGNSSDILFRQGADDFAMKILLDSFDRTGTAQLGDMSFVNNRGEHIKLSQFATIRNALGPNVLTRYGRESSITLTAQAIGRASGDINTEIRAKADPATLPGVTVSATGNLENQADSFSSLGLSLILSVLLIYGIMAILFDSTAYPLAVIFSLPFAVTGGLLALAVMNQTLNLFSIMAILLLLGLAAKNAILLVDRTLKNKREGLALNEALLEAVRTRIRPIVMTTTAMIFGMLPVALGLGSSGELKQAMGSVLIGGLFVGLFLTLLLVPVAFASIEKLRSRFVRPRDLGEEE
jgi:hydrophobic/amphiphilic exporter-1 (mainly G- bacteria), HAE1 family